MLKGNFSKLVIFLILLILAVGGFFAWHSLRNTRKIALVSIQNHSFRAQVVETESEKQKGLGGQKAICSDCGMLFFFDKPGKYSFWMKDMLFAIDILWIMDGKIIFIEKNVLPSFSGTMRPAENVNRVLEIKAGTVDSLGISLGDSVLIEN